LVKKTLTYGHSSHYFQLRLTHRVSSSEFSIPSTVKKNVKTSHAWWYKPVIPALGRLKQKDLEYLTILGNIRTQSQETTTTRASVAHICNPATQEPEIRRIEARSQPRANSSRFPTSKNPSQK
jgi:hypothetical protein